MIIKHIRIIMAHGFLSSVLVLTSILTPLSIGSASADCTPPSSSTPGVHRPTGADAGTYHYDCDNNVWVNDHFIYDPSTGETSPIVPTLYTCNPNTNLYDYSIWVYDSPSGSYFSSAQSTSTPPAGADVVPCPSPDSASIANTGPDSTNTTGLGGSINNTGANSTNTIGNSGANTSDLGNATIGGIDNTLTAVATSGNALVLGNTNASGANSGNTSDIANVVNLLQSSVSSAGQGGIATFTANINGDVNGDLLLDPALLSTIQPNAGSPNIDNNLDVNNAVSASINNNITLNSTSGDATVDSNTNAGGATTGNAEAIANIVNLINSAVVAGQSFIGTVNINGNLNGDILLPPNFIDQLLAANVPTATIAVTGPGSTNTIDQHPQGNTTNITNTNDQGITNNVDARAASGVATVAENTNAGAATSGTADTHITAFNLTGSETIGSNALLVFVNVLGTWVGMIVNAPAGTTAAELGGGITTNKAGNNTENIDNANTGTITNNLGIVARSGDATVTRNTNAGGAKTGDAKAAVNLLNIQNTGISLGNWFGILFINVFGTWHGSFGINTVAGNPPASPAIFPGSFAGGIADASKLVRFAPHSAFSANTQASSGASDTPQAFAAVLSAQNIRSTSKVPAPALQTAKRSFLLPVLTIVLFVAAILLEQIASRRPS